MIREAVHTQVVVAEVEVNEISEVDEEGVWNGLNAAVVGEVEKYKVM